MAIRLVLDTNVIVSGTFWTGPSFKVLSLIDNESAELLTSLTILHEYERILFSDELLDQMSLYQLACLESAHKLLQKARIIYPEERVYAIITDPSDNQFLEVALAGHADYIISQDKHLLRLGSFRGIPILTPEAFLSRNVYIEGRAQ